jgi:hypothetical protein
MNCFVATLGDWGAANLNVANARERVDNAFHAGDTPLEFQTIDWKAVSNSNGYKKGAGGGEDDEDYDEDELEKENRKRLALNAAGGWLDAGAATVSEVGRERAARMRAEKRQAVTNASKACGCSTKNTDDEFLDGGLDYVAISRANHAG